MAEEKKKEEKSPEEPEKVEIEDILSESEKSVANTTNDDDLDLEEAVSEEPKKREPEQKEETPKEPEKEEVPEEDKPQVEEKRDILEQTVEETPKESIGPIKEKKKRKLNWKIIAIVFVTVLVTAALALGGAYYFMTQSKKTEVKKEETKTEETVPEEKPVEDKTVYVNATDGLRLRETPDPNGKILDTMPFGTKLTPLATSGDWIKVEYNGKTGWCLSTYTGTENPLVYKNTDYKFQITFPSNWSGYKLFSITGQSGETAAWYVALPTTDTTHTDTGVDKGYASMFAITVYTKAQWDAAQAGEGIKPQKAAENATYVIGYSVPNGIPAKDLTTQQKETKAVIDTIKFY